MKLLHVLNVKSNSKFKFIYSYDLKVLKHFHENKFDCSSKHSLFYLNEIDKITTNYVRIHILQFSHIMYHYIKKGLNTVNM